MYYLRLFTLHKNDIKKTWCLINSTITNKSKGKLHREFDLDGQITTNSHERCWVNWVKIILSNHPRLPA